VHVGHDRRISLSRIVIQLAPRTIRFVLMRYSLHEIDKHHVVATTVATDRDEALEWFSEKLRLMLSFEGDPAEADYLLDEWPEGLLAQHRKSHHSGFRGERDSSIPPSISACWSWSEHRVSSEPALPPPVLFNAA
jgi:hypothetical protein